MNPLNSAAFTLCLIITVIMVIVTVKLNNEFKRLKHANEQLAEINLMVNDIRKFVLRKHDLDEWLAVVMCFVSYLYAFREAKVSFRPSIDDFYRFTHDHDQKVASLLDDKFLKLVP